MEGPPNKIAVSKTDSTDVNNGVSEKVEIEAKEATVDTIKPSPNAAYNSLKQCDTEKASSLQLSESSSGYEQSSRRVTLGNLIHLTPKDVGLFPQIERCWCDDCPWLIIYICSLLGWLVLVLIFCESSDTWSDFNFSELSGQCLIACSLLAPYQGHRSNLESRNLSDSCTKWMPVSDRSNSMVAVIHPHDNKLCTEDCMGFSNIEAFEQGCILAENYSLRSQPIFSQLDEFMIPARVSHRNWYWIVHVIVITNALGLLMLLVLLLFSDVLVITLSASSVVVSLILPMKMWWDFMNPDKLLLDFQNRHGNLTFELVCAIVSTIFCVYTVYNLFIVVKKLSIVCAILALTGKFVGSVPLTLLEIVLTMALLSCLVTIVIVASLSFESRTSLVIESDKYYYQLNSLQWIAQIWTVFVGYWTAHMLINFQSIIIQGVVAQKYFQKDDVSVSMAHRRLLRYHTCTAIYSALLFNWFYWYRWIKSATVIRAKSLYGTAVFGKPFHCAGALVRGLLEGDGTCVLKIMNIPNQFYFLVHVLITLTIAIFSSVVVGSPNSQTVWPNTLLVGYSYFVGLAIINLYRVAKDGIFLSFLEDQRLVNAVQGWSSSTPLLLSEFYLRYTSYLVPR